MGKSLEERKKGGPFGPRWQKVKGTYKALSGKLFKPDISPAVERYDQALRDYDAALKAQDKLKATVNELLKASEASAKERDRVTAEIAQLGTKFASSSASIGATLTKFASGGSTDFKAVRAALDSLVETASAYIDSRKRSFDEMDGLAYNHLKEVKKFAADFATQASDADGEMAKLEAAANGAEDEIMSTLQEYIGIADDADHPEIVKSLRSLKV
jgi:hypothetical protein